jgi:hypothetical protein
MQIVAANPEDAVSLDLARARLYTGTFSGSGSGSFTGSAGSWIRGSSAGSSSGRTSHFLIGRPMSVISSSFKDLLGFCQNFLRQFFAVVDVAHADLL